MNAFLVTYKRLVGEDAGVEYKELFGKWSLTNKNFFVLSSQVRNKRMASFDASSRFMYKNFNEMMLRKNEMENFISDVNFNESEYVASYEPVEFDITNYKQFNFEETERFAEDAEKYGNKGLK